MIKKFTLILRKNVYPSEYMNDWEKINETPLPEKKRRFLELLKNRKHY